MLLSIYNQIIVNIVIIVIIVKINIGIITLLYYNQYCNIIINIIDRSLAILLT